MEFDPIIKAVTLAEVKSWPPGVQDSYWIDVAEGSVPQPSDYLDLLYPQQSVGLSNGDSE